MANLKSLLAQLENKANINLPKAVEADMTAFENKEVRMVYPMDKLTQEELEVMNQDDIICDVCFDTRADEYYFYLASEYELE
jgi:hypothetical protein